MTIAKIVTFSTCLRVQPIEQAIRRCHVWCSHAMKARSMTHRQYSIEDNSHCSSERDLVAWREDVPSVHSGVFTSVSPAWILGLHHIDVLHYRNTILSIDKSTLHGFLRVGLRQLKRYFPGGAACG